MEKQQVYKEQSLSAASIWQCSNNAPDHTSFSDQHAHGCLDWHKYICYFHNVSTWHPSETNYETALCATLCEIRPCIFLKSILKVLYSTANSFHLCPNKPIKQIHKHICHTSRNIQFKSQHKRQRDKHKPQSGFPWSVWIQAASGGPPI